ncbi:MAG: hypothetical protein MUC63_02870 [Planctomycetes bacterium]|nr:hypothetical protein [Planctomycetota bacterium]
MRKAMGAAAVWVVLAAGASALAAEKPHHRPTHTDELAERDRLTVPLWLDCLDPACIPEFKDPRRLADPFRSGHNQFLHHLVGIPSLEGFRILERGRFGFDLGFEGLRETRIGEKEGNRWEASFYEATTRISYGLTRVFEVRAGFNVAWFRPDDPDTVSLTQEGEAVLPAGTLEGLEPGIGNVLLGLKIFSAFASQDYLGFSALLGVKIPVGKSEFLSTGRGDFSLLFAGTGRLDLGGDVHLYGHVNAGACWFDEENAFPEKVYLDPVGVWGASLVLPLSAEQSFVGAPLAFSAWVQGHGNAFRKMDVPNSDPLSAHAGVRVMLGSWAVEGSAGAGLSETGSPDLVVNLSVGSDF